MIDYRIDRSQGIIFITASGRTSAEEVLAHIQYMLNDRHFQIDYHFIAKINKDTAIDPRLPEEPETVQNILMDFEEKRKGSKCAIIVESHTTREIVEYGLNLIEFISSDINVFDNMDDALEWIGVSVPDKKVT